MVLVLAGMVLADERKIAMLFPFGEDGRAIPLEIMGGQREFGVAVFGKIMEEALPEDPHMKTIPNHLMPVLGDNSEMLPALAHQTSRILSKTSPMSSWIT